MIWIDYVLLLASARGTVLPSEEAALADAQNTTHAADREAGLLRLDEGERSANSAAQARFYNTSLPNCGHA